MTNSRFLRRAAARVRFGDLRRTEPLSAWGSRRGAPIDRWYIERFLAERAAAVSGSALEVKSDLYATRFGATSVDVVDIDSDNPRATVVGDLCAADTLSPGAYDVALITQTLQLVSDPPVAVRRLVESLRPGGSLLVTVPTLSRLVDESDRWRWTPAGLADLLGRAAPSGAAVESVGLGNGLSARAFLFGLSADDLDDDVLERRDPRYPLVAAGRLTLPA